MLDFECNSPLVVEEAFEDLLGSMFRHVSSVFWNKKKWRYLKENEGILM